MNETGDIGSAANSLFAWAFPIMIVAVVVSVLVQVLPIRDWLEDLFDHTFIERNETGEEGETRIFGWRIRWR